MSSTTTEESSIWIEKYRPQNFQEMILTDGLTTYFKTCFENKNIPHLLLYGRAGIGKTSIAKVITKELNADFLYINGSKEKTINVLRETIYTFATTYSDSAIWDDTSRSIKKIVIIDEFEKITFQEALKVILEEFQSNCRFILLTNNISLVIEPIRDERCHTFNLEPSDQKERARLAAKYMKKLIDILAKENVKYDQQILMDIVSKTFPSLRKAITTCHKTFLAYGEIGKNVIFDELINQKIIDILNKKDVLEIRKFCANTDPIQFFREFYESFDKVIAPEDYLNCASVYGEFAWRNSRHDDREQNLFMFLIALCTKFKFKVNG